jgi:hypothetical protein
VKQAAPVKFAHLFQGSTEKLPVRTVDKLDPTLRVTHPHRRRASIRQDAKERFFLDDNSISRLVNRRAQTGLFDIVTFLVHHLPENSNTYDRQGSDAANRCL